MNPHQLAKSDSEAAHQTALFAWASVAYQGADRVPHPVLCSVDGLFCNHCRSGIQNDSDAGVSDFTSDESADETRLSGYSAQLVDHDGSLGFGDV